MLNLLSVIVISALSGGITGILVMHFFYWYLIRQELKELDEIRQLHAEVDLNLANSKKWDDELIRIYSKAETMLEDITHLQTETENNLKTCREVLFDMTTDHDPALVELAQEKNKTTLKELSQRINIIYGN